MKSLSKLFLLLALLTTQQNILSIEYLIDTNNRGPLIRTKNISGESISHRADTIDRMRKKLLEKYGNRIKIEDKALQDAFNSSRAEMLSLQARWTSYSEMPRLNKLLALVVNFATRALEKC